MTLTDVAEDERWAGLSTRLQTNQQRNARASGVEAIVSVEPLDWEACVADDYVPAERYQRLLGSDLAYDERSIEALVAAVTKHLAPGGQACLVNVRDREGPPAAASAAFVEQAHPNPNPNPNPNPDPDPDLDPDPDPDPDPGPDPDPEPEPGPDPDPDPDPGRSCSGVTRARCSSRRQRS